MGSDVKKRRGGTAISETDPRATFNTSFSGGKKERLYRISSVLSEVPLEYSSN